MTAALAYEGWMSLVNAQQKWSSSNWTSAHGTIETSNVSAGRGNSRVANVEGVYTISGTAYRDDRMTFGDGEPPGYVDAQDLVRLHPPGKAVEIFHDPGNPARSSLSTAGSVGRNLIHTLICRAVAGAFLLSYLLSRRDS